MFVLPSREAVRLVLGALTERERVRFLCTNKALSAWLAERRTIALAAFEALKPHGRFAHGEVRFHDRFEVTRGTTSRTRTVTLDGRSLFRICCDECFEEWSGRNFKYQPIVLTFSPWAHALIRRCKDERVDAAKAEAWGEFYQHLLTASKRVV